MKKYIFMTLEVLDNGHTYYIPQLLERELGCDIETEVEEIAKTWYDDEDAEQDSAGYYEFLGGDVATKVYKYEEITHADYIILDKFLTSI